MWTLCRVIGKRTTTAATCLQLVGIECYCPVIVENVRRPKKRRSGPVEYAAFPGWLFIDSACDISALKKLNFRLVQVGIFSEEYVGELASFLNDISDNSNQTREAELYSVGEEVEVVVGPFQGIGKLPIIEVEDNFVTVEIPGPFAKAKINTFLLRRVAA